ncbi:sensor histidine kinase [Emcibacter sp.]|uniref:sensor histidine kinase n=1 Tax=Emcibacter sp. TaxID=1979954 RepID=UPI002AA6EA04|nr:ATP-binding protein [Emcibacter sp.]
MHKENEDKLKYINWLGEFTSKKMEREFVTSQWQNLVKNYRYFTYTFTVIFFTAIFFSLAKTEYTTQTYFNLSARILSILPLYLTMVFFMKKNRPDIFFRATFLSLMNLTGIFLLSIGIFISDNWVNFAGAFVLTTIAYTTYPMSNLQRIIYGFSLAVGLQAVNFIRFSPEAANFFMQSAMLFSANIFGFWQMHNTSILTRNTYLSLQREKDLNRKLEQELIQRKKAEEASRQNEELFRSLFTATMYPLAMIKTGSPELITANTAFYELFSLSARSRGNETFMGRFDHPEDFLAMMRKAAKSATYTMDTTKLNHKENGTRIVEICMVPVRINEMRFLLVGLSDITLRKQEEAVLRNVTEDAVSANLAKTEFLANMSHELRTPLNAILGFTEIMEQELLGPLGNEQYKSYLQDIHTSGRHLMELISEILDVAKIESGKFALSRDEITLGELIDNVLSMLNTRHAETSISVTTNIHDPALLLDVDILRIRQVILNLLGNALKFSHDGDEISISTSCRNNSLILQVTDQGIGIAPQDLERVFDPFTQVESSYNRKRDGVGLGLALSRKLVEAHDGTLTLESVLHRGTTVTMALPESCIVNEKIRQIS